MILLPDKGGSVDDNKKSIDWTELRRSLEPLLSLTLDQLSTFSVICEKKSIRHAALAIGRDQSSVEKQLQTMDRNFEQLVNEKLVLKSKQRGAKLHLTRAGTSVCSLAQNILLSAADAAASLQKLQKNYTIRIGLTTLVIPILTQVEDQISKRFARAGAKLTRELRHLRMHELQPHLLQDRTLDFCLGGMMCKPDEAYPIHAGLDFIEWRKEEMVLLSNWKLPSGNISIADLFMARMPLLLPATGAINDFMAHLGRDPSALNVVETCTDLHFALDLLRLSARDYCTICSEHAMKYAKALPDGRRIYEYRFKDSQLHTIVGLFRRRGEEEHLSDIHPVRMFWEVFAEIARKKCKREQQ
jgi:DNA-binding transcriptional LysR family regulator